MQAINPNAGYNYFTYGSLVGANQSTNTNYLYYPRGMAVDGSGNIYVVDSGNDRIIRMSSIGVSPSTWVAFPNSNTPSADYFYAPEGIAVDSTGANIWVADSGNGRIVHLKTADWQSTSPTFDTYSSVTVSSTAYNFSYPTGLAFDSSHNMLYLSDPGSQFPANTPNVFAVDVSSGFSGKYAVSGSGSGADQFSYPRGIAVDPTKGYVYVADETNYRIDRLNLDLTGWTTLGTRGSGTGQFISPQTVAVDSTGHIYVVDSANYWIVKMNDMSGAGWTLYGAQTGSASTSVYPNWVAVKSSGSSIYVSDDTMNQIAEFQ